MMPALSLDANVLQPRIPADLNFCGCGGQVISSETERFCSSCGLVADVAPIVESARFGPNGLDTHDRLGRSGRGSVIGGGGGSVGSVLRWTDRRHGRSDRRTNPKRYAIAASVADQLGLPPVMAQEAAEILNRANLRGQSLTVAAAAALVLVARRRGVAIHLGKASTRLALQPKNVGRLLRLLQREGLVAPIPVLKPSVMLHTILAELQPSLSADLRKWLVEVTKVVESLPSRAESPRSLATVSLYLLGKARRDLGLTQKAIALASGTTEVTVRMTGIRIAPVVRDRLPPLPVPREHG